MRKINYPAELAIEKLKEGNKKYLNADTGFGNISIDIRQKTLKEGQKPYAVIVTCSDSRVIPEEIFSADIGDLFVVRVAGNVIDDHQLGSIEYAAEHLGCNLVVVMGHNHCGAVDAAINHNPDGYIKFITDEIVKAIGDERDEYKACCLNAKYSCRQIESSIQIQKDEKEDGLLVVAALYHLEDGQVEFI
ncbi:MAG: carbonic anhydrase [Lachnospiraceae bacterium]|nr:carbonic anhydrase [Lachnospiraceae bacterium]